MGGELPSATRIHGKCTPPPTLTRLTGGMPAYQRSEGGAGVLWRAAGKPSVFLYILSLSSVKSWLPWDSGKFTRVLQPILGSRGCWLLSNSPRHRQIFLGAPRPDHLLQKESSAEVTWNVTPEWSPAPHCLSQPAFVLGFFPTHSCPGRITICHTVVPIQEYYAAKFAIACLHSVTLGKHQKLSTMWTLCHNSFVTIGFQTSNGKPSVEASFILQHQTFLQSRG